jgi:signal peptidase II
MTIKKKYKNFTKYFLVIAIILFFDLLSKNLIFSYLQNIAINNNDTTPSIELLPFLNIVYVVNNGISFGMLSTINNANVILSLLQGFVTFIILVFLLRSRDNYNNYSYSIIIGGALGNVIDRIFRGGVADFIDFHYNNYHWPAFNIADSAIFIGVVMILFKELIMKKND